VLSGISYAYYFETHNYLFRVISFINALLFFVFLMFYTLRSLNQKTRNLDRPLMLKWYIVVTFIIFLMSIKFTIDDLITLFFHPLSFGAFFIGVVTLLVNKTSLQFIIKMSRSVNNLIPIITIVDLLLFHYPILLISCQSFLLFEYCFTTRKRKFFLLILMLLSLPFFLIYDYRSGVLLTFAFFLMLFSIYFFKIFRSKFIRAIFLVVSVILVYYVTFNFSEVFQFVTSVLTDNVINSTDTRSFLFLEFFNDFSSTEYLFGRGYLGTYYSSYFDIWEGDSANRFIVEVGFLQLLFKGGIFLLGITILIFIKSIYNGLFKSNPENVSFLLSLWLIVEFAMFSVQNIPSFSPHFFIIWILIGILFQQKGKGLNKILQ
tara:strand:- start:7264 stop:8388 length:1125 start_codon:yes stop_codon:yes gene_type:complete